MWKGGSQQHFMTPLPWDRRDKGDKRANTQKLLFDYGFVNLTHFSVKDVPFSIKSTKVDKIHKIHAPKFQGRVFFEKKSPCGRHIDHGVLGGTLKSAKIDKIHQIHAPKFQGRVFSRKKSPCGKHIDHEVVGGTMKP